MNIDEAVQALRQGKRVTKEDWKECGAYLQLRSSDPNDLEIHIMMEGKYLGDLWNKHLEVLFAKDWIIVPEKAEIGETK